MVHHFFANFSIVLLVKFDNAPGYLLCIKGHSWTQLTHGNNWTQKAKAIYILRWPANNKIQWGPCNVREL
jgi:hypothetical protein